MPNQPLVGVTLTPQQATQVVSALEQYAARSSAWANDLYDQRGQTPMVKYYLDEARASRELAEQILALHKLSIEA